MKRLPLDDAPHAKLAALYRATEEVGLLMSGAVKSDPKRPLKMLGVLGRALSSAEWNKLQGHPGEPAYIIALLALLNTALKEFLVESLEGESNVGHH